LAWKMLNKIIPKPISSLEYIKAMGMCFMMESGHKKSPPVFYIGGLFLSYD
jgi:hypothetical protein